MVPIRLERLRKCYGSTLAVDDVTLDVPAGSLLFLLGASGCGKTTILRMIAGFIEPTSGRILLGGRDVSRVPPEARNCGMVFQSYALWPHMSVEQNVAFGLEVRGVARAERQRRVAEALESVRMAPYAARRPNQLSGGQQQRVALARALVYGPEVLLLDEPLSNLDAKLRLEMRSEIRRLCTERQMTSVYVTHDQHEALSMADSVVVMRKGRVEQQGAPRDLYEAPRNRFLADFLGETNILQGRVESAGTGGAVVETPAGRLRAGAGRHVGVGEQALVSVRCEAWRIDPADSARGGSGPAIEGRVIGSVYLGSSAQHTVEAGSATLRVTEHAPMQPTRAGERIRLSVDPARVVVLEDDDATA